jgi:hypothetical protein
MYLEQVRHSVGKKQPGSIIIKPDLKTALN